MELNKLKNYNIEWLDWGNNLINNKFDLIIGCDLIYDPESIKKLIKTFRHFKNINESMKIILATTYFRFNNNEHLILEYLKEYNLKITRIPQNVDKEEVLIHLID